MKYSNSVSDSSLKAGHRKRLRERFLSSPESLADYELLELVLGLVYLRRDNKLLAKRLMQRFGNLKEVFSASCVQLEEIEGCGPAVDALFSLLREISARTAQESASQKESLTIFDIADMGRQHFRRRQEEEVWAVLLDKSNRLIIFKKIRHGSWDHVEIDPRDIAELMIKSHASGLVLMHNHPGGSIMPSPQDKILTEHLAEVLHPFGMILLDHVIVSSDAAFSMVQNKRIEKKESAHLLPE